MSLAFKRLFAFTSLRRHQSSSARKSSKTLKIVGICSSNLNLYRRVGILAHHNVR
ncbi:MULTISPECIES: hypothetical protein [unclassified Campylobacter]|uniref:hypothetical protein n=1 Tax=unclassified Campylobacter TaxID=2593542 RepID=UPI0022E998DF|nr:MULTISPECIES: hypothetical protein [unclassified Campylobacter]MDA3056372.1 hypothetical protein [Campylobacter sp. CN_NA1]MDA3065497.1 hypothetical protein [Campylobacter sp. CN_NE4]MDA3068885.1 hypothetical protein [Campylobacter sp. CN_NE3]MDA3082950.1 hypothetical protein [Campylobacter sp. CN_EL2]MDA3084470.1 hypothetical protein [Campylobacter sp. CN_NE1]